MTLPEVMVQPSPDDVEPAVRVIRTTLARDHLVHEPALRVLREAFRYEPDDLEVLLVREAEEWAGDEDQAWPLPGA